VARRSGLSRGEVAGFEADRVTFLVSTALGLAVTPAAVPDLTGRD